MNVPKVDLLALISRLRTQENSRLRRLFSISIKKSGIPCGIRSSILVDEVDVFCEDFTKDLFSSIRISGVYLNY